jgi:hypothetical protein
MQTDGFKAHEEYRRSNKKHPAHFFFIYSLQSFTITTGIPYIYLLPARSFQSSLCFRFCIISSNIMLKQMMPDKYKNQKLFSVPQIK